MRWTPVAPLAASLLLGCNLDLGGNNCGAPGCTNVELDTGSSESESDGDSETDTAGPPAFWPGVVCTPDPDETPRFYFDLRAGKEPERDYFRLPYPADLRLRGGGLDLEGFPRPPAKFAPAPELAAVIDRWMAHLEQDTPGFAVDGAVLFRSNTGVAAVKGVRYLNITPGHPDYGKTIRGNTHTAENGPGSGGNYICDDWMAIEPIDGVVLDADTTYAVVITDGTTPKGGGAFVRDADLEAMFQKTAPSEALQAAAWPTFAPLREFLQTPESSAADVSLDNIVAATVFTTGPHRDVLARARAAVHAGPLHASQLQVCTAAGPSPCSSAPGLTAEERSARECGQPVAEFSEIHGRVTLPIFQEGRPPYASHGGKIQSGGDGPVLHAVHEVCFALTVPTTTPPDAGWPTLVFAHGTRGSFRSAVVDGIAAEAADAGIATVTLEGLLHGERRGDTDDDGLVEGLPLDQLVFNLRNPDAARDNPLQAAIDQFTAVRLARELAAATAPEPAPTTLDPANVFFMGHSQGAQAGVAFLPYEPDVHAAVISGGGANLLRALLSKTEPQVTLPDGNAYPPRDLLQLAFQERPDRPLTSAHPLLLLFNTFVNRADGDVYSPLLVDRPVEGVGAKHLLMYIGHVDSYTPIRSAGSLAIGAGAQLGDKTLFPGPCSDEQYSDDEAAACTYTTTKFLPVIPLPATGNRGAGQTTAVALMHEQPSGQDGHFVAFTAKERERLISFLDSARDGAVPTVQP
jgi:dienelactone hydrolase